MDQQTVGRHITCSSYIKHTSSIHNLLLLLLILFRYWLFGCCLLSVSCRCLLLSGPLLSGGRLMCMPGGRLVGMPGGRLVCVSGRSLMGVSGGHLM